MNSAVIGTFEIGEEIRIADLIKTVFDEFVAPEYSAAGNAFFHAYVEPRKIRERFLQGNVLLTAKENGKIIGVLEVRDHNHVCLLFVDKSRHGKGIAKSLLAKAVSLCRTKDDGLKGFDVNASPNSEKIYAKMGFKKTSDMQEVNGLKFVPMVLELG